MKHFDLANLSADASIEYPALEGATHLHVATARLRIWQFHKEVRVESIDYRSLLLVFEKYFDTKILEELGLPCSGARHATRRHQPDSVAVVGMVTAFFRFHNFDEGVVMAVYRKFQLGLERNSIAVQRATYPGAHLYNAFLWAFYKLSYRQRSAQGLGRSLDILAQLMEHHKASLAPPSVWPGQHPSRRVHDGPNGLTWKILVMTMVRHSQFQAAEKLLREIWKKFPLHYGTACDLLVGQYLKAGRQDEAMVLLKRKTNAGFETTTLTLKMLSSESDDG
jgi:hypothetical protein